MSELRVLFICIGNTCRSPMAEAIARGLGGRRVEAFSAGLAPTGRIASHAISAIAALGYSADGLRSKGIHEVELDDLDLVVSLIGRDGLQMLPRNSGAELVAWSIPDPYGEDEEVFMRTAELIERRVRGLLDRNLGAELFSH